MQSNELNRVIILFKKVLLNCVSNYSSLGVSCSTMRKWWLGGWGSAGVRTVGDKKVYVRTVRFGYRFGEGSLTVRLKVR